MTDIDEAQVMYDMIVNNPPDDDPSMMIVPMTPGETLTSWAVSQSKQLLNELVAANPKVKTGEPDKKLNHFRQSIELVIRDAFHRGMVAQGQIYEDEYAQWVHDQLTKAASQKNGKRPSGLILP